MYNPYKHEVTLAAMLSIVGYLRLEEHVKIVLYSKNEYEGETFKTLECNAYNVAKFSNYPVVNVAIDDGETDMIEVMIDADID